MPHRHRRGASRTAEITLLLLGMAAIAAVLAAKTRSKMPKAAAARRPSRSRGAMGTMALVHQEAEPASSRAELLVGRSAINLSFQGLYRRVSLHGGVCTA